MTSRRFGHSAVAACALALATAGVLVEAARGPGSPISWRQPSKPAAPEAIALPPPRPLAITIDGVSLTPQGEMPPIGPRLVARRVEFTLSTTRFHDVRDAVDRLAADHHGTVVGVVAATPGSAGQRSLTATLTVPLAEADAACAAARALGAVLAETPTTEDVTDLDRDLRVRLAAAEAEARRLTDLLGAGRDRIADPPGVDRAESRARDEAARLTSQEAALTARTEVLTLLLRIDSGS